MRVHERRPTAHVRFGLAATSLAAWLTSAAMPAAADPGGPARCMAPDRPASIERAVPADMPQFARAAGMSGVSVLQIDVAATGKLAGVWLRQSSGYPLLDTAAIHTAREMSYTAELHDCRPRAGSYALEVDWVP